MISLLVSCALFLELALRIGAVAVARGGMGARSSAFESEPSLTFPLTRRLQAGHREGHVKRMEHHL